MKSLLQWKQRTFRGGARQVQNTADNWRVVGGGRYTAVAKKQWRENNQENLANNNVVSNRQLNSEPE
jgi:hypothetical protein